jgi:hypothetical protein
LHNFNHKKLVETIAKLDAPPQDQDKYAEWIRAGAHLNFLRQNAPSDELVVYANGKYAFVDSMVVPNDVIARLTPAELECRTFSSDSPIASYVYGGGRKHAWIERGVRDGFDGQQNGMQLVFLRRFEGWEGPGRDYIEVNQEYTHLVGLHWRPEKRAYCRFDERGDLEATVSITTREDKGSDMALVTFKWEPLEEYLSVADAVLVRRFDFTLLRRDKFGGWPPGTPDQIRESPDFFYHQKVLPGHAAFTAGRQIIRARRPKEEIHECVKNWGRPKDRKHAEFIAYDWRNQRIGTISTAPGATTNYFEAENNSLPFELSPAFFRPEVLSKYKTDRDKYTLGAREVTCRTAWHLKGIDVNEAGQVHAYICDLSHLPHEEQLHWLAHNEQPKASISKRALINDFHGEFVNFSEPPAKVLATMQQWHSGKVQWWTLREENLLERVNTPLTASRDEWAEAFMDLAKLIVEGLETSLIRKKLDEAKIPYGKDDRTIALLEKLINKGDASGEPKKLEGLRTVQYLRSKLKGHVGGSEAKELAQEALTEHETFANHFKHVCALVADDLATVEQLFASAR